MHGLKQLIHEIHRRSLWQVLGLYLVGSWVALQVVEQLAEASGLPAWVRPLALALLVIFLPIVLATAFVQEGVRGPEGRSEATLNDDESLPVRARRPRGAHHQIFTWRNALVGSVTAFALLGVVSAGWLLMGGGAASADTPGTPADDERPSIAALPFVNLSADGEHAYFADGVHEQVLTQLTKIGGLKVISRTSVMEYRGGDGNISGNIPAIAEALGVRHVLEGSLQRDADRVRLTVQLIDAATDEHLWAESYDRNLDDIFEVQSELASRIASALDAVLSPAEVQRIGARPTVSADAYSSLLEGDESLREAAEFRQYDSAKVAAAFGHYEAAVALDPAYALPHARMSTLHTELYWWTADRTPERAERAEAEARRALELDPNSPEGHAALGRFHYRQGRYAEAWSEYSRWEALRPGDADAIFWAAMVLRRMNRWEESLERQRLAQGLDPLNRQKIVELESTLRRMRLWDDAIEVDRRWAELHPDDPTPTIQGARNQLQGFGDLAAARSILEEYLLPADSAAAPWGIWITVESYEGNHEAALAWASFLQGGWTDVVGAGHAGEVRGTILERLDRRAEAREAFESARAFLEAELETRPDDRRVHSALGRVYAALGQKEEAIAAALKGAEMSPLSMDPLDGSHALHDVAYVYTVVGEPDAAIEILDRLLSVPHYITVQALTLDPSWAPLWELDSFRSLLARHGEPAR